MSYGKKVLEQILEDLELMSLEEYEELYDRAMQREEVTLIREPVFTSCITYSKSIFRNFGHDNRRMKSYQLRTWELLPIRGRVI